jgi:hypothetical protein
MTALLILDKLYGVLEESEVFLVLEEMSKDKVPNVRFNVGKLLKKIKTPSNEA